MTSWQMLLSNGLWVMGLSLMLSGACIKLYLGFRARADGLQRLPMAVRATMARHGRLMLLLGMILFCAGLCWLSSATWERVAWFCALALVVKQLLGEIGVALTRRTSSKHDAD